MKSVMRAFLAVVTSAILIPSMLHAQSSKLLAEPFPPQIATAKTAFISYAGTGCAPEDFQYTGLRDRAFNQFNTAVRKVPYQFVAAPAEADLILEFQVVCGVNAGTSAVSMNFVLRVYEAKQGVTLWTFTEPLRSRLGLQKSRDTNFDVALTDLVDDLQRAATPLTPAAASPPQP